MTSLSGQERLDQDFLRELLGHTYWEVAGVFDGFQAVLPDEERGRFACPDKDSHADFAYHGRTPAPGYEVRSSFTEPQELYVAACVTELAKLATGATLELEPSMSPPPALSTYILDRFLGQPDYRTGFVGWLVSGTTELFTSFGSRYPNLAPALQAMHQSGAMAEGTVGALTVAKEALRFALSGEAGKTGGGFNIRTVFTGLHPEKCPIDNIKATHEVQCPAQNLAWKIIGQAQIAATEIANEPSVQVSYNADDDTAPFDLELVDIFGQITASIKQAYTIAHRA